MRLVDPTRASLCALLVLAFTAPLARAQPALDDRAAQIYESAWESGGDPAALGAGLTAIEAHLAEHPDHALSHYVRGTLLSALGRPQEAVAAYDAALALQPDFAAAHYNAGVVLASTGHEVDAVPRFDRAAELDPTLLDAHYNAGQALYNLSDYQGALERWTRARTLAPDDFEVVKKLLQAQNALGLWDDAAATRADLHRIWSTSLDPAVRGLTDFVFDQFAVGDEWVFAFETLAPSGDLYNLYVFDCTRDGSVVRSVNLESSAVLREMGTAYIVGVQDGDTHTTLPMGFERQPDYATLRPMVIDVIERLQRGENLGGASSTPGP